ncbi:LamG domain-containing protein, partial [Candidatus Nomurabacteria bacterium]|nr:LamG domain-containing protein [Candidatus Nomurabacteria bacterium]
QKGQANKATTFDGTNDYIDNGSSSTFNFGSSAFTVTGWFKTSTVTVESGSYRTLVSFGGYDTSGWKISLRDDGVMETWWNGSAQTTGSGSKADGSWHSFTYTRSGNTFQLYVDGVVNGSSSTFAGSLGFTKVLIGAGGYSAATQANEGRFNGQISDVRVYNRALSSTEVTQLYKNYRPKVVLAGAPTPVGRWMFDSASGLKDISNHGNNGSSSGGITIGGISNQNSVANKATFFDGTDDYVTVPDKDYFDGTNKMTWSFWYYQDTASAPYGQIMGKGAAAMGGGSSWYIYRNAGTIRYGLVTSGTFSGYVEIPLTVGQWAHIAIVYDGTNTTAYKNGAVVGSAGATGIIQATTNIINFGNNIWGTAGNTGSINDARIYNKALTAGEIYRVYQDTKSIESKYQVSTLSKGLVGQWLLDGNSKAKDKTPNGNNGTAQGGVTVGGATNQHGQANKATTFASASSQYIDITDNNLFDMGTGDFAISLWLKNSSTLATSSDIYTLVSHTTEQNSQPGFWLTMRGGEAASGGGNGLMLRLAPSGSPNDTTATSNQSTLLSDGNWHHIVCSRTSGTVSLYIDGASVGSGSNSNTITSPASFKIGNNVNNFYANHSMNDVRLYNRALSATEVAQLYQTTK